MSKAAAEQMLDIVREGQAVVRIENETIQQIATQRPRPSIDKILAGAIAEVEMVPQFASAAYYSIPFKAHKGDSSEAVRMIEGPSIKAANILARHYRNNTSGSRIVGEDERAIYVEGVAIDLETNVRITAPYKVSKIAWNKFTQTHAPLSPDRLDITVQADLSKARRNAILNLLPVSLVQPFLDRAKQVAAQMKESPKAKVRPLEERVELVVHRLEELGASRQDILEQFGGSISSEEDLQRLIGIGTAIRDGMTTPEQAFGSPQVVKPSAEQAKARIVMQEMLGIDLDTPADIPSAEELDIEDQDSPKPEEIIRSAFNDIIAELFSKWPDRKLTSTEASVLSKLLMRAYAVSTVEDVHKLGWQRVQAGLEKLEADVREVMSRRKGRKL